MNNDCIPRVFGSVHKFEPRYNYVFPAFVSELTEFEGSLKAIQEKHYVCDVCTYCGKVIVRKGVEFEI